MEFLFSGFTPSPPSFVDLTQYLDRQCGTYSGGNKRKLNVALALIGRPKVKQLFYPPLIYIFHDRLVSFDILLVRRLCSWTSLPPVWTLQPEERCGRLSTTSGGSCLLFTSLSYSSSLRSGTSVILTSHSMEECEALCDR